MDLGDILHRAVNYLTSLVYTPPPPKTAAQYEAEANDACWQDIYSEPCARLSDLAEQQGGINVRKELMDLDAKIRPMLNQLLQEKDIKGGYCAQLVEKNSCEAEPTSPAPIDYSPSSSQLGCYEVLQCSEAPANPSANSLWIYVMPESSSVDWY
jgi:hypothetical protein